MKVSDPKPVSVLGKKETAEAAGLPGRNQA
jgi:hypothetical protein